MHDLVEGLLLGLESHLRVLNLQHPGTQFVPDNNNRYKLGRIWRALLAALTELEGRKRSDRSDCRTTARPSAFPAA